MLYWMSDPEKIEMQDTIVNEVIVPEAVRVTQDKQALPVDLLQKRMLALLSKNCWVHLLANRDSTLIPINFQDDISFGSIPSDELKELLHPSVGTPES